jgi:chromosome segregation ATPase
MKDFLTSPTTIKTMLEAQLTRHQSDGSARELESAQAQWRAKKVEQERLLDLYVKARLNEERFTEKDAELQAQLQRIEENIERLERQVINQQQAIATYRKIEDVVQRAQRADLQHLSFDQKRQTLQTFQARVTAHGGDSANWHLQLMVDVEPVDPEMLQAVMAGDDSVLEAQLRGEAVSTPTRAGSRDRG